MEHPMNTQFVITFPLTLQTHAKDSTISLFVPATFVFNEIEFTFLISLHPIHAKEYSCITHSCVYRGVLQGVSILGSFQLPDYFDISV